jgi:hypothetical protein
MSRFVQALQHLYRMPATPIGFHIASAESSNAPLLVVASIVPDNKKVLKAVSTETIDAAIVETSDTSFLTEVKASTADIPLGLAINGSDIDITIAAGYDFIVYNIKTPIQTLQKVGDGKIIKIDASLDIGLVRAINELGSLVDGVLVSGRDLPLTVERLLVCQRFTDIVTKPVLIYIDSSITREELISLCEAGISGIVLPEKCTPVKYTELRKIITSLPKTIKRRRRNEVTLPRIGNAEAQGEEQEEEEDEDEDE